MMSTNTSMEIASQKIKVNHMEDRLSNLPNEILIKILSYLKTKEVVRTGILSTRWKSVWASVPTFGLWENDFILKTEGHHNENFKARFSNFVDKVLLAHKWPLLEKVNIESSVVDPDIMISWIRAALERNVSELSIGFGDISSRDDPSCELTHNLFSYNKLVVLKLHGGITLYFPTDSSCFPNLKVLELEDILYEDDDTLPNLLSSCPVLEDLDITRSRWDNMETLNLTSQTLKRLTVYTSRFENLDEQIDHGDYLKTVIDASAVESLDIYCFATKDYVVKDLSSVVEAKLRLSEFYSSSADINNNYIMCLFEFLRGISNVKLLTLQSSTFKALMLTDSCNLPMFHNLTRLEIYLAFYDDNERTKYSEWTLMLEILKRSPVLEILIFRRVFYILPKECCKTSDWDVPDCLVSHLKTIVIDFYYYESDDDMEKVKYFLKNAKVLEKMTFSEGGIIISDVISKNPKKLFNDISDVISKNPKSSVTCSEGGIIISFL